MMVSFCFLLLWQVPPEAFISPDPDVFTSATGGNLAVAANNKVAAGYLFPLPDALCFVERPALLVRHADISCVELGRANGVSSTFDLIITLNKQPGEKGGQMLEFGQIDRSDLGRIQSYIAARRLPTSLPDEDGDAGAADAAPSSSAGPSSARVIGLGDYTLDEDDDDDDEEEDSDFDPAAESGSEGGGGGRARRGAKRQRVVYASGAGPSSAAADMEEDDEEDEESYGGEDSGSDDGSSDEDDEEVELTDEEDIPAAMLQSLVEEDRAARKARGKRAAAPVHGAAATAGAAD